MINKVMPIFGKRIVASGGSPLLDTYGGATGAYSLRYLSTAFTGNAVVRVRRSSDNLQADFTPTEITDGTLTTWTGANDGFVTIWYDQSGNVNNYVQTSSNRQARIVVSGAINLEDGKPAILFDGNNDHYIMTNKPSTSRLDHYQVYKNNRNNFVLNSSGTNSNHSEMAQVFTFTTLYSNYGTPDFRVNGILQNWVTRLDVSNAITLLRVLETTNNSDISVWTAFHLSGASYSNFRLLGNAQEFIYYDTDQSINNGGIESNINSYYSIY